MNKFLRNVIFYLMVAIVGMWMFDYYSAAKPATVVQKNEINYSAFLQEVDAENVASVVVLDNTITGKTKDGKEFTVLIPVNDNTVMSRLEASRVDITIDKEPQSPWWLNILSSILPMLLIVGLWFFMMNNAGGGRGMMNFGRSSARRIDESK
ncbi:MAG: ATP-dependent metallopeptidase FtsH/Yme1/Tma family protein, partial [Phascolarctobacterium sp.]|nr:ATP-dependent metallopeptidase FtsH/Yme1/Tma family protein [Candidatus Phascolarctobacterium equi]